MHIAWKPTPDRLVGRLADSAQAPLTYAEVGATGRGNQLPRACAALEEVALLGSGRDAWERVAAALMCWELHREARMVLATSCPVVQVGCTVVNAAPVGPLALLAPCRVVAVVDQPLCRGFAYGTLPGHPLAGEEQFTVELYDGQARFRVRSFSRPLGLARLSPRGARVGQRLVNRRYLAAAKRLAA